MSDDSLPVGDGDPSLVMKNQDQDQDQAREKLIDDVLRFDALDTAEKMLGRDNPAAPALGFLLLQENSKQKQELMQATRDTFTGMPYAAMCVIVAELEFDRVYTEAFQGTGFDPAEPVTEEFAIWWHPGDGMLLTTESYAGDQTNSVKVQYQWKPAPPLYNWYAFTQSGGLYAPPGVDRLTCPREELAWLGDYDGRVGLRRHITTLRKNGSFMSPWWERQHLWFLNYAETRQISDSGAPYWVKSAQFNAVTERKLQQLPAHVQAALGPARE